MEKIQNTEGIDIEIGLQEERFSLMVSESPTRDLDVLLEDLNSTHGSAFISLLKEIASHPSSSIVKGEISIYSTGGEKGADYLNLLYAARKAVELGYQVFILPNPKGFRTADFIFERKGVYRMYDLKTIQGRNSVDSRFADSIGQTNRVILNILSNYEPRPLAKSIKRYFERNADAVEVLIMKGRKTISVIREETISPSFMKYFMIKYTK